MFVMYRFASLRIMLFWDIGKSISEIYGKKLKIDI